MTNGFVCSAGLVELLTAISVEHTLHKLHLLLVSAGVSPSSLEKIGSVTTL